MEAETTNSGGIPEPVNLYHLYFSCFFGRWSLLAKRMDNTGASLFGLTCCVAYNLSVMAGAYLIYKNVESAFGTFLGIVPGIPGMPTLPTTIPGLPGGIMPPITTSSPSGGLTPEMMYKILLGAVTPWFTVTAGCFVARKVFSREDRPVSGDVLISGLTLLPLGLFVLMFGLLGFANWSAVAVVLVAALAYSVMFLHQGLVVVSRIPYTAAAISVPFVLVLSTWLTKIVFTRLIGF